MAFNIKLTDVKILTNILSILDKRLKSIVTRFNHKKKFCVLFFPNFLVHFVEKPPPPSENVYFLEILATVMFVFLLLIPAHSTHRTAGMEGDR